jgi:hypothetical protein
MSTDLFEQENNNNTASTFGAINEAVTNDDPQIVTLEDVKDLEPEVALKRLVDSQNYIAVLKAENREARKSEERTTALEEAIRIMTQKFEQSEQPSQSEALQGEEPTHQNASENKTMSQEEIEQLVQQTLTRTEQQRSQQSNTQMVIDKMKEVWGNNYVETLKAKAQELGETPERLNALAASSPSVFIQALGLNAPRQEAPVSAPTSARNTNIGQMGAQQNVRNWAYYQKMRKENPRQYFSGETQMQMQKDLQALGEKFGLPT